MRLEIARHSPLKEHELETAKEHKIDVDTSGTKSVHEVRLEEIARHRPLKEHELETAKEHKIDVDTSGTKSIPVVPSRFQK